MASLDSDARLADLVAWSRSCGGALHDAVAIVRDDTAGLSLRVKPQHTLQPGDAVVSCPLSTSLSYLSALDGGGPLGRPGQRDGARGGAAFPGGFMQATPPHVVSRFFLMQQYLLGRDSAWWPYIATLPQPEAFSAWALPAVWRSAPGKDGGDANADDEDLRKAEAAARPRPDTSRALARLAGTNAGTAAADMRGHLLREFRQARAALAQCAAAAAADGTAPAPAAYTLSLYEWAYCLFTSRSFRPSLVVPPALHAAVLQTLPPGGAATMDDFSILLPVLDLANHDPRAQVDWLAETGPCPSSSPAATSAAAPAPARVAFVTRQPYAAGAQVFNHYGHKTNSELLLGYGFVLPPSAALHNDYVHLRRRRGGGGADDAEADDAGGSSQQQQGGAIAAADFLLSLRPLHDPSSLVGAARQRRRAAPPTPPPAAPAAPTAPSGHLEDRGRPLPAGLSHFEDALLWDLCTRLWTEAEQRQLQAALATTTPTAAGAESIAAQRRAVLELALGGEEGQGGEEDSPSPYAALADRVRQTLLAKVGMDYERLVETDPYDDEEEDDDSDDDDDDGGAALVHVAETYREQYRAVLISALTALDPEVEVVETA